MISECQKESSVSEKDVLELALDMHGEEKYVTNCFVRSTSRPQ
jgi:hypothetical protein